MLGTATTACITDAFSQNQSASHAPGKISRPSLTTGSGLRKFRYMREESGRAPNVYCGNIYNCYVINNYAAWPSASNKSRRAS